MFLIPEQEKPAFFFDRSLRTENNDTDINRSTSIEYTDLTLDSKKIDIKLHIPNDKKNTKKRGLTL